MAHMRARFVDNFFFVNLQKISLEKERKGMVIACNFIAPSFNNPQTVFGKHNAIQN